MYAVYGMIVVDLLFSPIVFTRLSQSDPFSSSFLFVSFLFFFLKAVSTCHQFDDRDRVWDLDSMAVTCYI